MTRQTVHRPENGLPVQIVRDEPRIDSRIVAEELGIQHDNLVQNLERYRDKLERLGIFRFQTEKLTAGLGAQAEKMKNKP